MNDWWIIGFPICWLIGYLLGHLEAKTCKSQQKRMDMLKDLNKELRGLK